MELDLGELAAPLDFESFFSLADLAVQDDGWREMESPGEGLSIWRREDSPSTVMLRTRYVQTMPPDEAVNLFRPEIFFSKARMEGSPDIKEVGINELIAPGDALGWTRLHAEVITPKYLKGIMLVGTLNSCNQASRDSGDDYYVLRQIRLTVRRDYPAPGMFAVARAPLNPKTSKLQWEWGISKASVGVFQQGPDPSTSFVTEVMRFDKSANLSTSALAAAPRLLTFFKQLEQANVQYRASPAFADFVSGAQSYVIVTLRKCDRGPPLLPCTAISSITPDNAIQWKQAEKYELPNYLRKFLQLIGLNDVEVHDNLDGRTLMHYQAALEKRVWERAWVELIDFWGKMQAAYRHTLGGVGAPGLRAGMPARFTRLPEMVPNYMPSEPPGLERIDVSVEKTFMHFGGAAENAEAETSQGRPRVGSDPNATRE